MAKVMKKVLIILIIAILVVEFSLCNTSFAANELTEQDITFISNLAGGLVLLIFWIPKLLATAILWFFSKTILLDIVKIDGMNDYPWFSGEIKVITPFDIFFNRFKLLDLNFFDMGSGAVIGQSIRESVATWFYVLRTISAVILLIILIYVGIRMALSTVATDRVKYRKMFFDWLCSLALIFVLQYLVIFLVKLNESIVYMIASLLTNNGAIQDSVGKAINEIVNKSLVGTGFVGIMAFLVYVIMIVQTVLFLIAYINRALKVAFLIIISPLISVTYSIDKMGDGKAQALEAWLKELAYTILIQPFHCIMYMAFVSAAAALMVDTGNTNVTTGLPSSLDPSVNQLTNGVLAILCLKFINDGEKVVRKIFNFQDDNSSTSMAAGAALAVMAVQKAKQVKGVGKNFKNSDLGKALTRDINKNPKLKEAKDKFDKAWKNTGLHKTITGVKAAKNKVFSSKAGKLASKYGKKSSAAVISAMAAAAMYATDSEGALESFAAGKRIYGMRSQRLNVTKSSAVQMGARAEADATAYEQKQSDEKNDKIIQDTTKELGDMGLSEDEIDRTEELEEKAKTAEKKSEDADENVDATRRAVAMEMRKKQVAVELAKINKQLNSGKYRKGSKEYNRLKTRKGQLKALESSTTFTEQELSKTDNDGRVKAARRSADEAREELNKAVKIATIARARQDAIDEKASFNSQAAREKRSKLRTRGISESEFASQKLVIADLIEKIKKQRELDMVDDDVEETDTNTGEHIVEIPSDSSQRTAERIGETIKHGVLVGSDFNIRDYMSDTLGITDYDDPNSLGHKLFAEIEKYQYMENVERVAESYRMASAAGASKDEHAEDLAATSRIIKRPKRKISRSDSSG